MMVDDDTLSDYVNDWLRDLQDSDPDEYDMQMNTKAYENSGGIHKGLSWRS